MQKMIHTGRAFIAFAMLAFGIQHIIYQDFITRAFQQVPPSFPGRDILACIVGIFMCVTGIAILLNKPQARTMTLALAVAILLSFVAFLLPILLAHLQDGMVQTNSGKALVVAGTCLLAAGSFPATDSGNGAAARIVDTLARLVPLGRYFLAGFFILAGTLHFVYAEFVATLIPGWIPGHLPWTYFTGCALIAGGIGIVVPTTRFLASSLCAGMIFAWVMLLHIPRALANIHDANETTATFEALAMCGAAILVAVAAGRRSRIA